MDIFFQHFDNNNQNKEMTTGRNSQQNKTSITKDYQQLHLLVVDNKTIRRCGFGSLNI